MKRSILAIAAIALSASVAQAQTTAGVARPVSFGVSAGATIPTGDLADGAATGFNVNGLLGFHAPTMPVDFRAELMYNRHGLEDNVDGNAQVLGVNFNALYNFPTGGTSGVAPYLIGGVGVSQLKLKLENIPGVGEFSESKTGFGLNGGIGIKMPLSGMTTFVEARYHWVSTKDDDKGSPNSTFIPISFGIMF